MPESEQRILGYQIPNIVLPQFFAQSGHFGHIEALVIGDKIGARVLKEFFDPGDHFDFL
jgi:hypothetical protein